MNRKMMGVAAIIAASSIAATASAATTKNKVYSNFDGTSGVFDDSGITKSFSDTYTFTTDSGLFDLTLSSASDSVNFTTLTFDGEALDLVATIGNTKYYGLDSVDVASGVQTLVVDGTFTPTKAYKSGSYDGTVEFTATSAAPEPGTWALMMAGIGGIGLAFRQAKKKHGFTFARALA
ncbi:MAG: FxDxF family PEP-CTERM protein, partial [Caulobacteraceae bacterium]